MARKRRDMGSFNLSFLDCMCCGFGAVVLFFMIITASAAERKDMLPAGPSGPRGNPSEQY